MKAVVIIEAGIGSSRFPGKVLLPLAGAPLLQRMIERVSASMLVSEIVVATSDLPVDTPIRDLCRLLDVACFVGNPTDLLDRHYRAAARFKADPVVRIPSSCPLIDPAIIDRVITFYHENEGKFDYVSNLHPGSYPDGNDVEILPYEVLYETWAEAYRPYERKHTTPFVWERPERFRLGNVRMETGLNYSISYRWAVDYPEDYLLVKSVFEQLWSPGRSLFSLSAIVDLLDQHPEIRALNAEYTGVNWYRSHVGESRSVAGDGFRKVI